VTPREPFDLAVIGAGPAGIMAALTASRRLRTLLTFTAAPAADPQPRLETVPASTLGLLIDIGAHPARLGIDRLSTTRHLAWAQADPQTLHGRAVAHIEHGALVAELFAIAQRTSNLTLRLESCLPVMHDGQWHGDGWRATTLVDATGRAMAFTQKRLQAPKPWVARPFWVRGRQVPDPSLRIASLPFGYAFRLGAPGLDMLWIAGRGTILAQSLPAIGRSIVAAGAGWLLEGFPTLESAQRGRAYPASVQWARTSSTAAVGDAFLARDILSSQGIASGICDAMYAACAHHEPDRTLWQQRQHAERGSHLRSLAHLIGDCRFRSCRVWAEYGRFIGQNVPRSSGDAVALRQGRIIRMPPGITAGGAPLPIALHEPGPGPQA
jgi:2-polyprenyl-6-methoxyphenol hydroxylase-like FAD-dependent oxidoreductase